MQDAYQPSHGQSEFMEAEQRQGHAAHTNTSSQGSGDRSKYQLIKMLKQMCPGSNSNSNSTTSSAGASDDHSDNASLHELASLVIADAESNGNTSDLSVGQSTGHDDDIGNASTNTNNNGTVHDKDLQSQTSYGSSTKRKNDDVVGEADEHPAKRMEIKRK